MRWVAALFLIAQAAQQSAARVTVELKPDCLTIVDRIEFGFAETVWRADGVAHIRISEAGVEDTCPVTSRCRCVKPAVRSLTSSGGSVPRELELVLDAPLATGEYVVLLARESGRDVYSVMGGNAYAFPIRGGRVQFTRREPGFTDGMTVPDFMWALAKMRRGPVTTRGSSGSSTGVITGLVADSAGGLIPGATITLRWPYSEQTTVTDAHGMFRFHDVRPGRYALVATLQGFYSLPHTAIAVAPDSTVSLRFEMDTDCMRAAPGVADQGLP